MMAGEGKPPKVLTISIMNASYYGEEVDPLYANGNVKKTVFVKREEVYDMRQLCRDFEALMVAINSFIQKEYINKEYFDMCYEEVLNKKNNIK